MMQTARNQCFWKRDQYIKFAAVTEEEYKKIEKEVEDGTYKYVVYDKEV